MRHAIVMIVASIHSQMEVVYELGMNLREVYEAGSGVCFVYESGICWLLIDPISPRYVGCRDTTDVTATHFQARH